MKLLVVHKILAVSVIIIITTSLNGIFVIGTTQIVSDIQAQTIDYTDFDQEFLRKIDHVIQIASQLYYSQIENYLNFLISNVTISSHEIRNDLNNFLSHLVNLVNLAISGKFKL
jgi:predicted PurR-regulated permease PerM